MVFVSVIVPITFFEHNRVDQIYNFFKNFNNIELIFVSPQKFTTIEIKNYKFCKFILSKNSRANALNCGVQNASGEYLLFFHSDTKVSAENLQKIFKNCNEKYLYYSKLKFYGDSIFCHVNAYFANLRSKILKAPFGDQMFFINKQLFLKKINHFCENLKYGEDHVLTWQCKENNIKIKCTNVYVKTSSVKYDNFKWFKTTIMHQYYFWLQFFKYLIINIKKKYKYKMVIACFCKMPIPGAVKTRIASTHGEKFAADIYKLFLYCINHTLSKTKIPYIFAIGQKNYQTNFIIKNVKTMHSGNGCLGQRLSYVVNFLKQKYSIVTIIGSDIPTINSKILKKLNKLHKIYEIVIGPSPDGGFYLISSNIFIQNNIFENVEYSKNSTLTQLIKQLKTQNISYFLIESMEDIDTIEELKNIKKMVPINNTIQNPYLNQIINISKKL